jgi:hypothetical protein
MKERLARTRMLSATRVAAFCEVDIKTVHNWANRGKIPGIRTRGRHLRFRGLDVVDFLRAYGFEIPEALRHWRPRVVVIEADARVLEALTHVLSRRFEVTAFAHVVDGLVALAARDPDIVLLGDVTPLDAEVIASRLSAAEGTRHLRVVRGVSRGAPYAGLAELRERIERLAGLG